MTDKDKRGSNGKNPKSNGPLISNAATKLQG